MKTKLRSGRVMSEYSGCMWCFCPQEWCDRWEEREDMEGGFQRLEGVKRCKYEDMIVGGLVVGIWRDGAREERFRGQLRERMREVGLDFEAETERMEYLGRRVEWGGVEGSNLLREYWRAVKSR
jgi:hypothetical protein